MSIRATGRESFFIDVRVFDCGACLRQREHFLGGRKAAEERHAQIEAALRASAEDNRSLKDIRTLGQALMYYQQANKGKTFCPEAFERLNSDLGHVLLSEIRERYREYWIALRRDKSPQTGRLYSASAINHHTAIAKAALNLCVEDGKIQTNPLARFDMLKIVPRDIALSDIDRQRLLNVVDKEAPHLSAIVRFALAVPSRKAELVALRREDLDLFHGVVRVRHGNAKGNQGSWKPIPPGWLTDYFRDLPADTEYLFYRRDSHGKCRSIGDFKKSWNRCRAMAGMPDLHFHDTRHVAAGDLINAGNPEEVVCQVAGWTSGNMLKVYYHKDGLKAAKGVQFLQKVATCTGHLEVASG